jgi:hypothetical protein
VLAVACVICSTASAGPRGYKIERAVRGSVEADLSFVTSAGFPAYRDVSIDIVRGGKTVYTHAVANQLVPYQGKGDVLIRDLDGDGTPEIVFSLYSGGAHCCQTELIYRWTGQRYRLRTQDFGNPGVAIRDLNGDGLPEFVTGDGRFAYRFTDYADSAWPIVVERYMNGSFVDVTRRFPEQIRADATRLLRGTAGRADLRGILAGWAADECLLGRSWAQITPTILAAGTKRLTGYGPSGASYLGALHRFLVSTGYLG